MLLKISQNEHIPRAAATGGLMENHLVGHPYLLFTNLTALHSTNYHTVGMGPRQWRQILHKRVNQRSILLWLLWVLLQVVVPKQKLGARFVCHGCNVFYHHKLLLKVILKYLESMNSSSTCPVNEVRVAYL